MYKEYAKLKIAYHKAIETYSKVVEEKAKLINRCSKNTEKYIVIKDSTNLDYRLEEAEKLMRTSKNNLEILEADLKKSNDIEDKIYVMYYIDRLTVQQIEHRIPLHKTQIYEIKNRIRNNLRE